MTIIPGEAPEWKPIIRHRLLWLWTDPVEVRRQIESQARAMHLIYSVDFGGRIVDLCSTLAFLRDEDSKELRRRSWAAAGMTMPSTCTVPEAWRREMEERVAKGAAERAQMGDRIAAALRRLDA